MSGVYIRKILNLPWEGVAIDGLTVERRKRDEAILFKWKSSEIIWEFPRDYIVFNELHENLDQNYWGKWPTCLPGYYSELSSFLRIYFNYPVDHIHKMIEHPHDTNLWVITKSLKYGGTRIIFKGLSDFRDIMLAADRRVSLERLSGFFFVTESATARRIISYRIGERKKCRSQNTLPSPGSMPIQT